MMTLAQRSKNPKDDISHHGLIKLLVEHALQKEGWTWNDVVRTPIVIPEDAMVAFPTPRKQRLQLYLQEIVSQLQWLQILTLLNKRDRWEQWWQATRVLQPRQKKVTISMSRSREANPPLREWEGTGRGNSMFKRKEKLGPWLQLNENNKLQTRVTFKLVKQWIQSPLLTHKNQQWGVNWKLMKKWMHKLLLLTRTNKEHFRQRACRHVWSLYRRGGTRTRCACWSTRTDRKHFSGMTYQTTRERGTRTVFQFTG